MKEDNKMLEDYSLRPNLIDTVDCCVLFTYVTLTLLLKVGIKSQKLNQTCKLNRTKPFKTEPNHL